MPGKLKMIVGPMRSNKTAELLQRIEIRKQYAKQDVMLLKPADDTKAEAGLVGSRNRNGCGKMEAVKFRSADPWPVLPVLAATEQRIGKRIERVAIDEGQPGQYDSPIIMAGDFYEPRCCEHFILPGRPHQEEERVWQLCPI